MTGAESSRPEASSPAISVVIPCYREKAAILDVLAAIPASVGHVVVVDDACPDRTGAHVREHCPDPRVEVVEHSVNTGVGGATLTGFVRAIEQGADIIVKLDGDGQMDPALLPFLVQPLIQGRADYAKGNRFHDLSGIRRMPPARILGNLGLSFLTKLSSGYWNIFDPTNGYVAIHAKVAALLPREKIARGFFFESDMLFRLNTLRAVVVDVPMDARYGKEVSSLSISRVLWEFPWRHAVNTFKRIGYTYFLRDFNMASIELALGLPFLLFGLLFGLAHWGLSRTSGVPATAGTVVLAALPIILGFQMLLGFLDFDSRNVPKEPLHPRL